MDVRHLVMNLDSNSITKSHFKPTEYCVGIGPYNWVFRNEFPSESGLYWFYIKNPVSSITKRIFLANEVLYIGMASKLKSRISQHMQTAVATASAQGEHPWGVGKGWEFPKGDFFLKYTAWQPNDETVLDLIRTGEIYVGWSCLLPTSTEKNALEKLESRLRSIIKEQDGVMPLLNVIE